MKLSEYIKNNGITYSEYLDILASRTEGVKSLTDIKKQQRVALKLSINELNNDYNKLYESYNSRFFDENGNFKNSYGKTDNDSKFNEFLNEKVSLTDKIENIQTLLVENQNIYEQNTVNNIQKMLNETTEALSKMSDTYKFYSDFHTETDYNIFIMNNIGDIDDLMTFENVELRRNAYKQNKERLKKISEEIKQLYKSNDNEDNLKILENEESKLKEGIKKYERFQGISDNYYIPEDDEFISNSSKRNYKNATKEELARCDAEYRKIMYNIEYQGGCFDKDGNITRGIGGEIIYPATKMSKAIMNGNIDDIYNSLITDKYGFFIAADKEEIEYYPFALDSNNEDSYYRLLQLGDINAWNYMTEYEIDRYYQKLNTEGQKKAYKYLEDLTPLLTYRETQERADNISNLSNGELVLENILSVPKNILGGILAFGEDTYNCLSGNEINPYSRAHSWSNDASAVRNTTAQKIENATDNDEFLGVSWGDVYQAAMSSADSVAGSLCFGNGYTAIMGMGAASRKAKELYDQGASNDKVALASLSSGIIEMFFEKVSLDYFFDDFIKAPSNSIVKNLSKVAVQAGVEMSEETFTEIANVVSDVLILGDRSKWKKTISEYKDKGYSDIDAIISTMWDIGGDVLEAGICGFISGGLIGLSGTAVNVIKNSNNLEKSYKLQLDMIENNNLNQDIPIYISESNNELQKSGLSYAPIIMEQKDYKNFTKTSQQNQQSLTYNIPYEFFENMPQYISEPAMVINRGNRAIIVTDYLMSNFSNNSFVAVDIEKNQSVGNDVLNVVKNVYPIDSLSLKTLKSSDNGKFIVVNKNKAEHILNSMDIQSADVSDILKNESVTRAPDASKMTPDVTSKSEHASLLSSNGIPQNVVDVNNQAYNKKSEGVTQVHTANKNNLPYGYVRNAYASPLSGDSVSQNVVDVNNQGYNKNSESVTRAPDASKKTPEVTFETGHVSTLPNDSILQNEVNANNQGYDKNSDGVSRNGENVNNQDNSLNEENSYKTNEDALSIFAKSRDESKALSKEEIIKTREFADAFGLNVKFEDLRNTVSGNTKMKSPDGYIDKSGNIYINLYSENPYRSVLIHETVHFSQNTPEYKRYSELVRNTETYRNWLYEVTGESDLQKAELKFKEQLTEINPNVKSSDSLQAGNELVAYFTAENLFTDNGENIMNAALEMKPKQRNAFVRFINNIIDYIRSKLSKIKWFKNTFADKESAVLENSFRQMVSQASEEQSKGRYKGETSYCFALCNDEAKIKAAEQMRSENKSYADIYKEHQLIKDAYGNWLFELSTKGFTLFIDGNAATESHYYNNKLKRQNGVIEGKLKDFVAYKALYEYYPQLKNVRVVIKDINNKSETIRYVPNANTIFIRKELYDDYKRVKNSEFTENLLGAIQTAVQVADGRNSNITLDKLKEYEKNGTLPHSNALGRNFTAEEAYNNLYDNYESKLVANKQKVKNRLSHKHTIDEIIQNDESVPKIDYDETIILDKRGNPIISDVNLEDAKSYQKRQEINSKDYGLKNIINRLENGEKVDIEEINSVPKIEENYKKSSNFEETYKINTIERQKLRENLLKSLKEKGSAVTYDNGKTEYNGEIEQGRRADIVLGLFENGEMVNPISGRYNSRIISNDAVKATLPEFNSGIGSQAVNQESENITSDILNFAVSRGNNFVYSTIGNDYAALIEKIDYFKENGYSVYLHLNEISNDKAIAKALKNYVETDNFISPNSIAEYGDTPTENFKKIVSENAVDGYSHYLSDVSDGKGLVLKDISDNIKAMDKEFSSKSKNQKLNTDKKRATSENEVAFALRRQTVAKEQMKKELNVYKNSNKLKHTLYPERQSAKNDVSGLLNLRAGSDGLIYDILDKKNRITDVFDKSELEKLRKIKLNNFDELNFKYDAHILEKFENTVFKNKDGSLTSLFFVSRNSVGNIEQSPLGITAGTLESAEYLYSETKEGLSRNTPLYITEIKGVATNPLIVPFELKNSNMRQLCDWLLENKYIKKSEYTEIARLKSAFGEFDYENHRSRKIRELIKSKSFDSIIYPDKTTDRGSVKAVFFDSEQVLEVAKNGVLIENNGISENYFDADSAENIVTAEENTRLFNKFVLENALNGETKKSVPKKIILGSSDFMNYTTVNKELAEKAFERSISGKQRLELSGVDTAGRNVVKNVEKICKDTVFKNQDGDLLSFVLSDKSFVDIENSKAVDCVFSTVESVFGKENNLLGKEKFYECYLNSERPLFLQMNERNIKDAAYFAMEKGLISKKIYYETFETNTENKVINESSITDKFIDMLAMKNYDSIVFTDENGEYKVIVFDKNQIVTISENGKRISNSKARSETEVNGDINSVYETNSENVTETEQHIKGHSGLIENNGYDNLTAKSAIEALKARENNIVSQTDTAGRDIQENVKTALENSILKTKEGTPYSVFVKNKNNNDYSAFGQYVSTLKAVQDLTAVENSYGNKISNLKENYANIKNPYFVAFDPLNIGVDDFVKYMLNDRVINNIEYVNLISKWRMNNFEGAKAITETLKTKHFDSIAFVNKNYDAGSLGFVVFDEKNLLPVDDGGYDENVTADSFDEPAFFDGKIENENFVEKSRTNLIDNENGKDYNDKAEREKSYKSPYFWRTSWKLGRKDGKGYWGERIKQKDPHADKLELQLNPRDESYYLPLPDGRCVQFENMINGIVQDCKCVTNKKKSIYLFETKPAFLLVNPLNEARRQAEAAKSNGYKVQWLVSDREAARQIARVFKKENIDIEVIYYPEQE